MSVVEDAVEERVKGGRPGWLKALGAAAIVGGIAAVVAYRLLRSEPDDEAS